MSDNPCIINADERRLVELINGASRRIVYMAPGLTRSIAAVLSDAWRRLGSHAVSVILDVDPEVCRLGYGTLEGLKEIQNSAMDLGVLVCHQPGVRIGLLISDDVTLIHSPTPLLVEAQSKTLRHPNAILLGVPPAQLSKEIGLGENPDKERSVGLDPVRPAKIQEVEHDISNNPPVEFDLARKVRVFTSRFQFVELEMTGCYISRKKVPIPSSLIGLANEQDVQSQFHAHFNLVSRGGLQVKHGELVLTEEVLRKRKEQITKDFLIPLKSYGNVVLRANKDKLINAVETLRAEVKAFQDGVCANLQTQMDENAKALVNALLPAVTRTPPTWYTKFHGPVASETNLRPLLAREIGSAFGRADSLVREMNVNLIFKDVAYESLVDEEFLEVARRTIPGLEFLHEEYDAARAKSRDVIQNRFDGL